MSSKSVTRRKMFQLTLSLGMILALSLSSSHPAEGQQNPPPAPVSVLWARDSTTGAPVPILDSDFAKQLKDTLTVSGKSNVKDAVFLFQQCYGQGFLLALKSDMDAAAVISVGGSAAAKDKCSSGPSEPSPPEPPELSGPGSFWTHAIVDTISDDLSADPTKSLFSELEGSKAADMSLSDGQDSPQVMLMGDETNEIFAGTPGLEGKEEGRKITLKDPEAKSHHAILFSGFSTKGDKRHYDNIRKMLKLLQQAWQGAAVVDIQILFGNGTTQPDGQSPLDFPEVPADKIYSATKENLDKALQKVKPQLNINEQFLFYATAHGGSNIATEPSTVGERDTLLGLSIGQIEGAQQLGTAPTVTVQFQPQPTSIQPVLEVDGHPVGALDTSQNSASFAVNGYLFHRKTEVTTDPPFAIQEFIVNTGAVDEFPPPSHGQPLSLAISGPPSVTTNASTTYVTYQALVRFADGSTITVFPNWSTTAPGVIIDPYTGFVAISPISTPTSVTIHATWTDPTSGTTITSDKSIGVGPTPPLSVGCMSPTAQLGSSYSSQIPAAGGQPPYVSFVITQGSLPPGLFLNMSTGAVTGSPTTRGIFTNVVTVTDSSGVTQTSGVCVISVP
jgi:hypothetical protein